MAGEGARLAAKQGMGNEANEGAWFKERLECLDDRRHIVPSFSSQCPPLPALPLHVHDLGYALVIEGVIK